jgi:uncharacterized protein (TIGR01777 family)
MRIGVTGCTGFIGRRLVGMALRRGHEVVGFSRDPEAEIDGVSEVRCFDPTAGLDFQGLDAVVHLAGETVMGRWTVRKRARILESRVEGTKAVVEAMRDIDGGPKVLVTASAIGFYGNRGDEILVETSEAGGGFLADVVRSWEEEASRAEALGVRVAMLRIGLVLGEGGFSSRLLRFAFSNGLGGRLGSGKQWMSWIHVEDVAGLCLFALENERARGVINAVSPDPVRNADFTRVMAAAFGRRAVIPAPAPVLRLVLGEASELLLSGSRVEPRAALASGYEFRHPVLSDAIEDAVVSK